MVDGSSGLGLDEAMGCIRLARAAACKGPTSRVAQVFAQDSVGSPKKLDAARLPLDAGKLAVSRLPVRLTRAPVVSLPLATRQAGRDETGASDAWLFLLGAFPNRSNLWQLCRIICAGE